MRRDRSMVGLLWLVSLLAASCGEQRPPDPGDSSTQSDGQSMDSSRDVSLADGGTCEDRDNDGHPSASCGGDDCDDTNPRVNPSAREVCDSLGTDEDCNPCTVAQQTPTSRGGDGDEDEDGFPSNQCFNRLAMGAPGPMCSGPGDAGVSRVRVTDREARGTDCGDSPSNGGTRFPGATEQCNNLDDNCDGVTDEGVSVQCYTDVDADGFAPAGSVLARACRSADPTRVMLFGGCPAGTTNRAPVAGAIDCEDGAGGNSAYPGGLEQCDGLDNDCNGVLDDVPSGSLVSCALPGARGVCARGRTACMSGRVTCAPVVMPGQREEMCNGEDDDCDGATDEPLCVDSTVDASGAQSPPTGRGVCRSGACEVHWCVAGRADCDGDRVTGCEANTDSDPLNCGACGVRCASGRCARGICAPHDASAIRGVAVGSGVACLWQSAGPPLCWGQGGNGALGDGSGDRRQAPRPVIGVSEEVRSLALSGHGCVALSTGAVRCWGTNFNGQLGDGTTILRRTPVAVAGITDAASVGAGLNFSCAVRGTGGALCWGANNTRQLGDGSATGRLSPQPVMGLADAVEVVGGTEFACARRRDGSVWCWGNNDAGQLGRGAMSPAADPAPVVGLSGATALALGDRHACARTMDGRVFCWGDNSRGQLGLGTTVNAASPAPVPGISDATDVAAGSRSACVVRSAGVSCWGDNQFGHLGDGTRVTRGTPGAVVGLSSAVEVSGGPSGYCARRANGTIACWGLQGGLPPGREPVSYLTATDVPVTKQWVELSALRDAFCARSADGAVACWGANESGQLGGGASSPSGAPTFVRGLSDARRISVGAQHACAVRADRSVQCWGANVGGQLGDGTTTARLAPTTVVGLTDAIEVGAGADGTCATRADGSLFCWGSNSDGQLGDGTTTGRVVPTRVASLSFVSSLSVASQHTCATDAFARAHCWGENFSARLGDGTLDTRSTPTRVLGSSSFTTIRAAVSVTCATSLDDSLYCWGANAFGQLGNGISGIGTPSATSPALVPGLSRIEAFDVGSYGVYSVTSSEPYSWGRNATFELGQPMLMAAASATPTRLVLPLPTRHIEGSDRAACAIEGDSTIRCWGDNGLLQLGSAGASSATARVVTGL
jgi:alpha-tubulin suppressor-like RCC1 family protein